MALVYLVFKTDSVWQVQVAVCVCVARTQIQFWEPFCSNLNSIGQTENDDVWRF